MPPDVRKEFATQNYVCLVLIDFFKNEAKPSDVEFIQLKQATRGEQNIQSSSGAQVVQENFTVTEMSKNDHVPLPRPIFNATEVEKLLDVRFCHLQLGRSCEGQHFPARSISQVCH